MFFHLSALLFAWIEFSWPVALSITVVLCIFVYGMYTHFSRIYGKFQLKQGQMIDGRMVSANDVAHLAGPLAPRAGRHRDEATRVISLTQRPAGSVAERRSIAREEAAGTAGPFDNRNAED